MMKKTIVTMSCFLLILATAVFGSEPQIDIDVFPIYNQTPHTEESLAQAVSPGHNGSLGIKFSNFPISIGKSITEIKSHFSEDAYVVWAYRLFHENNPYKFSVLELNDEISLFIVSADMRMNFVDLPLSVLHDPKAIYIIKNGVSVGYAIIEPLAIKLSNPFPAILSIYDFPISNYYKNKLTVPKQRVVSFYDVPRDDGYIERYGFLDIKLSKPKLERYDLSKRSLFLRSFYPSAYEKEIEQYIVTAINQNINKFANW